MTYFAHSENPRGEWNPLERHLREVAGLASRFAGAWGESDCGYLAGLLHDLGKYGDLFQARLRGEERGLDHWSIGASECLKRRNVLAALAIQGHHIGLQWAEKEELRKLLPPNLERSLPEGRRLTERDAGVLLARLGADGLEIPLSAPQVWREREDVAAMLDVRMLFSALVDADYLATERHFSPRATGLRGREAPLNAERAQTLVSRYIDELAARTDQSSAVAAMRKDLRAACEAGADLERGLFTLTAPTGSGKTLSTLLFAMRHARRQQLRRIVVVLPFLSIIDQTVEVYRRAMADLIVGVGDRYLLEHHSLAVDDSANGDLPSMHGLLAQNWDAPVVITTSVQFFESLFSNSPAACRKLHRLAGSLVVFDEVQTLPLKVVVATLSALSHLSARYGASVLFSTATQPAFGHLDREVREFCAGGWAPREIVPKGLRLFERAKRVRVEWPAVGERVGWQQVAEQMHGWGQALCIVNLKRHARELYAVVREHLGDDCFHLSTAMCPRHRDIKLREVRDRLSSGGRCVLVATQCVEAGVDLDFPAVFRALGPLDAIAQAAGRCNRNGRMDAGLLRIFVPEDERYPPGGYGQATQLTKALLNRPQPISLDDPTVFEDYFRNLYRITKMENRDLADSIRRKHFPDVRRHYRIIDTGAVNVLVAHEAKIFSTLADEVRRDGLSRDWVSRARPFAVSCFLREIETMSEPVPMKDRTDSGNWFMYLHRDHYSPETGLVIPRELAFLDV
jgi:CRISPR-associated endonuclease/helicase Cas3